MDSSSSSIEDNRKEMEVANIELEGEGAPNPNASDWQIDQPNVVEQKSEQTPQQLYLDLNYRESSGKGDTYEQNKDLIVGVLASRFHDNWREGRLQEDGAYAPRVKVEVSRDGKTKWVNEDQVGETDEVIKRIDIANTDYEDLPPHWQADNKAAAETVSQYLAEKGVYDYRRGADYLHDYHFMGKGFDFTDVLVQAEAGKAIHDAWLDRNEWARGDVIKDDNGNPKLNQRTGEPAKYGDPFEELPEDEKAKDLDQVRVALVLENQYRELGAQKDTSHSGVVEQMVVGNERTAPSYDDIQKANAERTKQEKREEREKSAGGRAINRLFNKIDQPRDQ
ncbi:MAG: hypothetical protein LBQ02_00605 [Candidatus Nomurabacteria bacterium]|nr:hypothetical protein [Candidatus Nomurabacteria bacterium]